jgi:hypothetical protein
MTTKTATDHLAIGDDTVAQTGMTCTVPFVHVAGQSINLNSILRCNWSADGTSVTLCFHGMGDLTLTGADRDLVAEAVGLPSPGETAMHRASVKKRLNAAQQVRLDAAKAKKEAADAKEAAEVKAAADAAKHEADVKAKHDAAAAKHESK